MITTLNGKYRNLTQQLPRIGTARIVRGITPFPRRLTQCKKEREEKKILETFQKVEINIPLLDAVKHVPHYAKFLKELCTCKKKLLGNERVNVGENVFVVLQKKIPPMFKDKGMFFISCKIGKVSIKKAMCDLGAFINVMLLSIYKIAKDGSFERNWGDHSVSG